MEVKDSVKYREVNGAAVMLTPEFIDDFEFQGVLDYCRGDDGELEPHVVEYRYGGNEMADMLSVRRVGKFTATIRVFGSKDDEGRYVNENRWIHGGEFLHKDFENPLSVFHKNFVKRVIRRRGK